MEDGPEEEKYPLILSDKSIYILAKRKEKDRIIVNVLLRI